MPRTTTSALLKTQKSRQNEIWGQEDSLKDYEWTLSDKSPEAYAAYIQHYKNRMNSPQADGDKMLTYQKRLSSANKAYTSNEIQRASIDIIEGRQPEEYKIQVLEDMYTQAYQLGDMDLAQSLRYQLDNQYVQQQNRQLLEMAAYGGGGYGSGGGYGGSGSSADLKEYVAQVTAYKQDVNSGSIQLADKDGNESGLTLNDVMFSLDKFGTNRTLEMLGNYKIEGATPTQVIQGALANAYDALQEMADSIPDELEKQKMKSSINAQINSDNIKIGGHTFNLATLEQMLIDEAEGNPSYRAIETSDGFKLEKRKNIKSEFRTDENGYAIVDESTGRPRIFTTHGDEGIAGIYKGYNPGQEAYYEIDKFGNLVLADPNKVYDKNGQLKDKNNKKLFSQDQALGQAGIVKSGDNRYSIKDPYLAQQLRDMGFNDADIGKDQITYDEGGTISVDKDGRKLEIYKNPGEQSFRVLERIHQNPDQLIGGRNVKTGLGSLQSNLPGGSLQPSNASRILGTPSGVSGILRQNADTIMANNKEKLRVQSIQEEERRAANRTVTVANTAPMVTMRVPTVAQQQQQVDNRTVKVTQPTPQRTVAVTPTNTNRTVTVSGPKYTPPPPAPKKQNVVQKAARWFKGLF